RHVFALACLSAAALVIASCVPASKAPESPSKAAPEPAAEQQAPGEADSPIRDALAELDRAERDISGAIGADRAGSASSADKKEKETLGASKPHAEPQGGGAESPCAVACRALSSMRNSAKHLCDLTGQSDSRCSQASARVDAAAQRVRASCSSC